MYLFLNFFYSNMPRGERDDNLAWQLTQTSVFDVHSYYNSVSSPLTASFPSLGRAFDA